MGADIKNRELILYQNPKKARKKGGCRVADFSAPGMYYEKVYSKQLVNVLFIGYLSFDGYSIWERKEENMIRR